MRAMILAAGRGERLRPATDHIPKPLLEIGGQTLISTHIRRLAAAGIHEIVVNLAYLGDQIRTVLGDGTALGVNIVYSEEAPEALDTGGGIRAALPLLGDAPFDGPFLVLSADIWTDFDARTLIACTGKEPELVFVPNPPHRPGGDYGISEGRIVRDAPRMTYAGIGRFIPAMFDDIPHRRFGIAEVIDRYLAHQAIRARIHRGLWRDLGRPEDLARARQLWSDANA